MCRWHDKAQAIAFVQLLNCSAIIGIGMCVRELCLRSLSRTNTKLNATSAVTANRYNELHIRISQPLILLLNLISVLNCATFKWTFLYSCEATPIYLFIFLFAFHSEMTCFEGERKKNEEETKDTLTRISVSCVVMIMRRENRNCQRMFGCHWQNNQFSVNTRSIHVSAYARLLRSICWWWHT